MPEMVHDQPKRYILPAGRLAEPGRGSPTTL